MKLKLLLFGVAREIIAEDQIDLSLQEGASLLELKKILYAKYSRLEEFNRFLFAVNESYEEEDYLLKEGDVVALIPPVSGG